MASFFGGVKPLYYYKPINNVGIRSLIDRFPGDIATSDDILSRFGAANDARIAALQRLGGTSEADLTSLFSRANSFDPMATREAVLSGDLAKLSGLSGQIAGLGAGQEKELGARWNMARGFDSRPGSYEKALTFDRVSRNLLPLAGSIFSGATPTTQSFSNILDQNTDRALTLLNARLQTPNAGVAEILDPLTALNSIRGAQTAELANLAGVAKANSAGFKSTPGISDYMNYGINTIGQLAGAAGGAAGAAGGGGGGM